MIGIFTEKLSSREKLIDILSMMLYASFVVFTSDVMGVYYMIGITAIISLLHYSQYRLRMHIGLFHKYMAIWGVFCLTSTIWALNGQYAIEKGVTIFELLVLMTLLYEVYYNYNIERLLNIVMWAGFLLCIYTILFVGLDSLQDTLNEEERLETTFANVNTIGMTGSMSILISYYFWNNSIKGIHILFCIPSLLVVAGSGSRKALVMLIVGVLLLSYFTQKQKGVHSNIAKRTIMIIGALITVMVLFFIVYKTGLFQGTIFRLERMYDAFTGGDNADSSSLVRAYFRMIGFEQFCNTPILGIGIGNARILALAKTGHDCYLHCNYAELAADGGIVGLILYYWIYFGLIRKENKLITTDVVSSILMVIIILQLVMDYGAVSYYAKKTYFLLLILMLHYERSKIKRARL